MDISYLLFLQDFRSSINEAWTPFMEWMSLFSITYLLFIPVFVYWCINKRKGLYILVSFFTCTAINAVIKLTVCAYRPWIRDPRIVPAGDAIATAGGYSFPSGHTSTATPIYGGLAITCWSSSKTKWLSVLCVAALLITCFSRNYLGVHTPQDVLVGLCLGVLILWGMKRLFNYLSQHPQKEDAFLLSAFIVGILAIVYITFKSYPVDYVAGKLLVDPQRMMNDAYKDIGTLIAFCPARYIEKRWIKFTQTGLHLKGIIWGLLGFIPMFFITNYLHTPLVHWMGPHWGRFAFATVLVFYLITLYPLVLSYVYKHK